MTLEFTGLRVINVENLGGNATGAAAPTCARSTCASRSERRLGAAQQDRDEQGAAQRRPQHHLQAARRRRPGARVPQLHAAGRPGRRRAGVPRRRARHAGRAASATCAFRPTRQGSIDGCLRLRAALADRGAARAGGAALRRAMRADPASPSWRSSSPPRRARALALFAGRGAGPPGTAATGGLQAMADFMEANVPEAERVARPPRCWCASSTARCSSWLQLSREQAGLQPLAPSEKTQAFMTQAVLSLSRRAFYPAPMAVAAEGLHSRCRPACSRWRARPGKNLVYLGCALLILGVFAMLYVRERRLWIWLQSHAGRRHAGSPLALSSTPQDPRRRPRVRRS